MLENILICKRILKEAKDCALEEGPIAILVHKLIFTFNVIIAGFYVSTSWNLTLSCKDNRKALNLACTLNTSMLVPAPLPWLPRALPHKTLFLFSKTVSIITFILRVRWTSLRESKSTDKKQVLKGSKKCSRDANLGPYHFNTCSCVWKGFLFLSKSPENLGVGKPMTPGLNPKNQTGVLICFLLPYSLQCHARNKAQVWPLITPHT